MTPQTPLSRRTLLSSSAVAGAGALTLIPGASTSAAVPMRTPKRADALVESFGIVVHLNWHNSVYGKHGRVIDWLERLGARHVRTRVGPNADALDAMAELSRRGIRVQGTCGVFGEPQSMNEIMRAVERRFKRPGRVFDAFEGLNEPNNDGVPWIEETRRRTKELHEARRRYGLGYIPIVAPALARVTRGGVQGDTTLQQARNLGSLAQWVDIGNMHVYPQGKAPSEDIAQLRRCARIVAGQGPVMCTEGGYFTAMGYRGPSNPVPHAVAAAYAPQNILEHWIAGTQRFIRYELLDEPDADRKDREGTLGTIKTKGGSWSPKQDFRPVRRLLHKFADPGDQSFARRPLGMALRDAPRNLRSAVFVKRDGTHLVALWLDRNIYDPLRQRMLVKNLKDPINDVVVTFDERKDLTVERLVDPSYRRRYDGVTRRRIGLTAGVTILTIR